MTSQQQKMTFSHFLLLIGVGLTMGDVDCKGDGLRANYTSGCRQYYRCSGGLSTREYSCPEGTVFQPTLGECLPAATTPCVELLCASGDSGSYAAPGSHCQHYYRCQEGTAVEMVCPTGSWFDTVRSECTQTDGVCYEPVCTGQRDGRHPDTTQQCRRALVCGGGRLVAVESTQPTAKCPSPRSAAVAFPVVGLDRCARLPDGRHASSAIHCRGYVECQRGTTIRTVRCPEGLNFDGSDCSSAACTDGCTGRRDGFHVDLISGCRNYYYCREGSGLLLAFCPDGSLFDGNSCVSSAIYRCPVAAEKDPCSKLSDGLHRDTKDCGSYISCSGGRSILRESCLDGRVWNGKKCVESSEFYCEGPVVWSGCADRPTGYYQDKSRDSDCVKYYYCDKGMKTNFKCSAGLVFDGEECVSSKMYTCPSLEIDSCDLKSDGLYQQTSGGCRAYYMCTRGFKNVYLCDVTQLFNGEKCVAADSYECPYPSYDCRGKSNGYHKDVKSNCRKYFFCENGEKLTTIQCLGSKIFNGQKCVHAKDYQCPVGLEGNPCALKPDGQYVEDSSNCGKYFKCEGYKLISRHSCPAGQVFDGLDSCAVKNCSSQPVTCEKDGFFLDLESRCRLYHICIDKKKSTLRCDDNKVFNGELCVPDDTFPCPDECSQNYCNNNI